MHGMLEKLKIWLYLPVMPFFSFMFTCLTLVTFFTIVIFPTFAPFNGFTYLTHFHNFACTSTASKSLQCSSYHICRITLSTCLISQFPHFPFEKPQTMEKCKGGFCEDSFFGNTQHLQTKIGI